MSIRGIAMGVLCGLFFESILIPPAFGFYFAPPLVIAVVFVFLPFTVKLLNIALSALAGFITMMIWSWAIARGEIIPASFLVHMVIIISASTMLIYYVSSTQKT